MLVFVDESGDPGMKLGKGSTHCFAVALVIFHDRNEAIACNDAIAELRADFGYHARHEFKFNKCSRQVREAFLQVVSPFEFQYHAVVLNKAELVSPGFQKKENLYKFPIKLAFENAKSLLSEATVFFDSCGSREFIGEIGRYLKKQTTEADGTCVIKKVRPQQSHSNNLIQLADMVCGAVMRSFKEDKADRQLYRGMIRGKEVRVQFWPK